MNIHHWVANCRAASTLALRQWANYKTIGLSLLALDIALFGNVLSAGLGHSLHLLIQFVEIGLEHFLENAFDLTPRQAQFVLAYGGLIMGIGVFVYVTRKAYLAVKWLWLIAKLHLVVRTEEARSIWHYTDWNKILLTLGAVGATLILLT